LKPSGCPRKVFGDKEKDDFGISNLLSDAYAQQYNFGEDEVQVGKHQRLCYFKKISLFDKARLKQRSFSVGDLVNVNVGYDDAQRRYIEEAVRIEAILTHRAEARSIDYVFLLVRDLFDARLRHRHAPDYAVYGLSRNRRPRLLGLGVLASSRPPHFVPVPDDEALRADLLVSERFDTDAIAARQLARERQEAVPNWPNHASRLREFEDLWWLNGYTVLTA
jgi:hypothetical protein